MKYAVVYVSATGNTAMLADKIDAFMKSRKGECVYFGGIPENMPAADIVFAGFWTDKGNCSESLGKFLQGLRNQKIFLFGTAGFGGAKEYFDQILSRVKSYITDENTVVGEYMCQGKMPASVKARYEKMLEGDPLNEKTKAMIQNFDQALSHPDDADLEGLQEAAGDCLGSCFSSWSPEK